MNGEDLKFLADRAETVRGRADQRIVEVHARIRSARRRRAAEAVAATSAAVLALVICIAVLTGPTGQHTDNGPFPPANSDTATPTSGVTRKIVYNDDMAFRPGPTALIHVGTLHVGDREVEIDQTLHTVRFWSMFVTDAGAVYAQVDHSVWFTDGGRPRQISPQACVSSSGDYQALGLATGNAGPLVAWFDCAPASRGDLVVYDTGQGREVARHPIPSCGKAYECVPDALIGEHTYFAHLNRAGRLIDHQLRFDVASEQVHQAGPEMYADDLLAHPRALVIGDSWQTGTATEAKGAFDAARFRVVGTRLVPLTSGDVPTRAFDNATGRPVRLRLPRGYHPDPAAGFHVPGEADALLDADTFTVFEWLDDHTVALAQDGNDSVGDIITCHLSDGRCDLSVKQASHDEHRIVAGGTLPG